MTQHSTPGGMPPNPPTNEGREAEIIPLPSYVADRYHGFVYDMDGKGYAETTEIREPVDASMSNIEIEKIIDSFDAKKIMRGVGNSERPLRLTEWILQQAHVSPLDYRDPVARQEERERLGRRIKNSSIDKEEKQNLRERLKKLKEQSPYEEVKVALGKAVYKEIEEAVAELDEEREKLKDPLNNPNGIDLLSVLDGYENVMKPMIAHSNVIRIFNGIFDRMQTPDEKVPPTDVILARRILLMYFKIKLTPSDSETTADQS